MTLYIGDSATAQTPAAIQAAGLDGNIRYASHGWTATTAAELAADRDAGLIVGISFEDGATNALGGAPQGQADGAFTSQFLATVAYPAGCIVWPAADFDCQPDQIAAVTAYYQAFAEACPAHTVRPYGSGYVLAQVVPVLAAADHGGRWGWQSGSGAFRDNAKQSDYAALWQHPYTQTFDRSQILDETVPLWGLTPPHHAGRDGYSEWSTVDMKMPVLSKGDRDAKHPGPWYVHKMQALLSTFPHTIKVAVTVDGVYGDTTDTAVRNFQAANGIAPCGHCGPETWQALLQPVS